MDDSSMIDAIAPKVTEKPVVRCSECDREVDHYNTFVTPTNETYNVCWECLARTEKGFFAKRDFRRGSRFGYIPR